MSNKNTIQKTFPVMGMSCAACAARVDKALNHQPGVRHAAVNYAAATATVEYDSDCCDEASLQHAVQAAGYDGPACLELFRPEYWRMPAEDVIRMGAETTRPFLG